VREGVGCRVCGNPLGMIYVPCQAAAEGLSISPRTIPSVPPLTGRTQTTQNGPAAQPFGPNYWLPTCQRRRNAVTEEIYNFFSESVRAAPEFTFPPPSSEVPPSWTWSTRPPSPTTPVALASQHPPATSTPPVSFAPPWWTYGLPDPLPAGESHDGDTTPQDDEEEAEVDGAEKSEDSGPDHGGGGGASPLWWVEL